MAEDRRGNAGTRTLSLTEGLVLCLVRERPTYGLVLAGLLAPDGSLGRIWSVPKAMVYYALQQLELIHLIRMSKEQRTSRGPARSIYKITARGQLAAQTWLGQPVGHVRDVRSELMVKLALNDRAGVDSRPLVRAQLAELGPVASALADRLGAATGFEHTLVLWRHEAMTATMQFLTLLAEGEGARSASPGRLAGASRGTPGPAGPRRSDRES